MNFLLAREYNEAAAKAAYLQGVVEQSRTQDLTADFGPTTNRVGAIFTAIAGVFVGLRFFSRWHFRLGFGWDDWFSLASVFFLVVNTIQNSVIIDMGLGKHAGALTLEQRQRLDKTLVGSEVLYVTNVSIFKLSLLCLYVRLFPVRSVRIGGYILGSVAITWSIVAMLASAFQCNPRHKLWEPWVEGKCFNMFLLFLGVSVPNILCDMGILCLPMPQVWKLKTTPMQRVFISGIFLLGSYVVFTSAYRFRVYLEYDPKDVPYTLANGALWNIIEISSGTVSACLPTLGPLIKMMMRPFRDSDGSSAISSSIKYIRTFGQGDKTFKPRDPDASLFFTQLDGNGTTLDPRSGTLVASISRTSLTENSNGDEVPLTSIQQKAEEYMEEVGSRTNLENPPAVHIRKSSADEYV